MIDIFRKFTFLFLILTISISCGRNGTNGGPLPDDDDDDVITSSIVVGDESIKLTCLQGVMTSEFVAIENEGDGEFDWNSEKKNLDWLSLVPESGKTPSNVQFLADCTQINPGTYLGYVDIKSDSLASKRIVVALTVNSPPPPPVLSVSPTSINMNCDPGGSDSKVLNITNIGGSQLNWNAVENASWLSLNTIIGTAPSALTLTADCSGLSSGSNHSESLMINSSGITPVFVQVYLDVSGTSTEPEIDLAPDIIDVSCYPDETKTASLAINNSGTGTLDWNLTESIDWLTPALTGGTAPSSVTLNIDCTDLSSGDYSGDITVSSSGIASKTATVNLEVKSPPAISLSPAQIDFSCYPGETKQDQFTITNSGNGELGWYSGVNVTWLGMNPTSGLAPSTITLSLDCTGLTPGDYQDTLRINGNTVIIEAVNLTVNVTVIEDNTAPPPPDRITLSCIGPGSNGKFTVVADWPPVVQANTYKLYMGEMPDPATWMFLIEQSQISRDIYDILQGLHYFGVKSVNSDGIESNDFTFDSINCSD